MMFRRTTLGMLRSKTAARLFLAAILVVVVSAFFVSLERNISELSPEKILKELKKSDSVVQLKQWNLHVADCSHGPQNADYRDTQACVRVFQASNVSLPLPAAGLLNLPRSTSGSLQARITHQLTPRERRWLQHHQYANLLIPRNVQKRTRFILGEMELVSLGNGANTDFLFESTDLLRSDKIELVFDYAGNNDLGVNSGFDRFGPLDVPIALTTPESAALYESLPTRLTAGTTLLHQASLSFRLNIATMAVVLDHSIPFASLSVFALLRTLRGLFSIVSVSNSDFRLLVIAFSMISALTSAAFALFVCELCHLRPKKWRWVAATVALMLLSSVAIAVWDPKALFRVDLFFDSGAHVASIGIILWSLWMQFFRRPESADRRFWFNSREHDRVMLVRKLIILVAIALQITFDAADLHRIALGEMKEIFDWRQTLFFPMITLAGLLEVGFTSRKVQEAAEEMTKKAVQDREIALAREYQLRTIPELRKAEGRWRWRALYHPATKLGGDWFDVRELTFTGGDTVLVACLADITGHGLEAALSTTIVASAWGLWCSEISGEPLSATPSGREALLAEAPKRLHMALTAARRKASGTAFFVMLHEETVCFCSAGHPPALLWDGVSLGSLMASGPQLGQDANAETPTWSAASQSLPSGAKVVLFSDGIVPVEEGLSRGISQLRRQIKQQKENANLTRLMAERVLATSRFYRSDTTQEDDMTLLFLHSGNQAASPTSHS